MNRPIVLILLVNMLMVSGCQSGKPASGDEEKGPKVLLNGMAPDLTGGQQQALADSVLAILTGADDFYELLVNDRLLESITGSEQYLEVVFPEAISVKTSNYGELTVMKLLIPLSGKFAPGDQLTFFSGKEDLSNTPLIASSGLERVRGMVFKE